VGLIEFLISQIHKLKEEEDVSKEQKVNEALEFTMNGLTALAHTFPVISNKCLNAHPGFIQ
jgi:hypothetical protein